MTPWLRRRTVFQRVSLVLLILALGTAIASYFFRGVSAFGFVLLALLLCYLSFRQELLWRVRNRLLVTYFLFGVVPLFLIGWLSTLTAELLFGQIAALRVQQDLEARIETVRATTHDLLLVASDGAKADLLDAIRRRVPRLATVVRANHDALRLSSDSGFQTAPTWIAPGFADLFEAGGQYYVGAKLRDVQAEVFAYLPLDEQTLASLTPGVVSVGTVIHGKASVNFEFRLSGSTVAAVENGVGKETAPAGLKPPRGWWDIPIASVLARNVQTSSGKEEVLLPLLSRPSLLVSPVPSGQMASIALSLVIIVGGFFFLVEAVSLFSSLRLTRTITRSVHDLYQGTLQVARGDFSHQIPVRGEHQLSELATSFNGMTTKVRQLISEVKKKEKLDAELEIARQVQLRLFPRSVPQLKTLEMAGICLPGRVVSGDYYDYVRLDNRWTAIALGDVSGKGVSAALLMASIQSALHAQLKFSEASTPSVLSMATLMALISQQLYESTPPEKYATFFCSVYDDETGRFTYTNAGHLKPILVRDGQASTLEGGGLVAGLLPGVKYEQQEILFQTGDLVAIFSDGIPEAENAAEQEFGEARLAELLVSQADKPLNSIITAVIDTVQKWIHDPEGRDDVTLLLLRKL